MVDELGSEEEVVPRRTRATEEVDEASRKRRLVMVVGLCTLAGLLAALFLTQMKDRAIYSKPVDELLAQRSKFAGRAVRVEGNLVHGSLMKRDQPCEYRFVLSKNGAEVPVRYAQCIVPDNFRDVPGMDLGVTVEGELQADNSFEATNVFSKCPSKYEMQDRASHGEAAPHVVTNGT